MHACPMVGFDSLGSMPPHISSNALGQGRSVPVEAPGKAPRRGRAGDALPQQGAFCARPVLRGGKTLSFPQRDKRQGYTLAPYA